MIIIIISIGEVILANMHIWGVMQSQASPFLKKKHLVDLILMTPLGHENYAVYSLDPEWGYSLESLYF